MPLLYLASPLVHREAGFEWKRGDGGGGEGWGGVEGRATEKGSVRLLGGAYSNWVKRPRLLVALR